MFLGLPSIRFHQAMLIGKRNMATRGLGCLEIEFLPNGRGAILALLGLLLYYEDTSFYFMLNDEILCFIIEIKSISLTDITHTVSDTGTPELIFYL